MSVKDFKEEIIKNNQLVIRWDFIMESHETKYKVWVEKEYMKMFVISNELTKEKHDLEEFLNKKYEEYKAQSTPKKDAPFYQGMTKEETVRSLSAFRESSGMTTIFSDYYVFGWVLVLVANKMDSLEYVYKKNKGWMFLGKNTLYYKELILESPTQNIGGKVCELVGDKMEKEAKELLGKVDEGVVNSLDKSGEDVDSLNDGILAKAHKDDNPEKFGKIGDVAFLKDFDFAEYSKKMILAQHGLSGVIAAQDLIQAAKDELVDRTADLYVTCSIDPEKQPTINVGFAECIKFLEQTIGKDPYKN